MNSPLSILVVDDEPAVRSFCARALQDEGFRIESAADGRAAMERLNARSFDFVLTDLSMPKAGDGRSLTEEIKRRWPATDVVIMTAYPALETAIPTLKMGAYDYLIKPFSGELLRSVVARCFERRLLASELNREKLLRQELEAAYAELQKVERLKEAILSRLSHELRSPLSAALMALEAIEAPPRNPESSKACRAVRSSLVELRETVEDLLLFAELSGARVSPEWASVDIQKLIEEVVGRYGSLAEERGIVVEVAWEARREAPRADSSLLATAFKHLFLNAVHFNGKGGRIRIRGSDGSDGLRVSFADTGRGIPKEKLPLVFDGFYQAAEYLARDVGGLGVGLAIVRRIAEAHGGSVGVESRESHGSVFTMRLPLQMVSPAAQVRAIERESPVEYDHPKLS